jgi:hypothetical protein
LDVRNEAAAESMRPAYNEIDAADIIISRPEQGAKSTCNSVCNRVFHEMPTRLNNATDRLRNVSAANRVRVAVTKGVETYKTKIWGSVEARTIRTTVVEQIKARIIAKLGMIVLNSHVNANGEPASTRAAAFVSAPWFSDATFREATTRNAN